MNAELSNEFYTAIIKNFYRSLIVEPDLLQDVDRDLCDITEINENSYYVTLSEEGVIRELHKRGISKDDIKSIVSLVRVKEVEQQKALVTYLKLERELKGSVVYVMLRDGRVDTDEDLFKDTYCLPLKVFFDCLVANGFKAMSTDTIMPSSNIMEEDYRNYLFNNDNFSKLLSVFINVSSKDEQ